MFCIYTFFFSLLKWYYNHQGVFKSLDDKILLDAGWSLWNCMGMGVSPSFPSKMRKKIIRCRLSRTIIKERQIPGVFHSFNCFSTTHFWDCCLILCSSLQINVFSFPQCTHQSTLLTVYQSSQFHWPTYLWKAKIITYMLKTWSFKALKFSAMWFNMVR